MVEQDIPKSSKSPDQDSPLPSLQPAIIRDGPVLAFPDAVALTEGDPSKRVDSQTLERMGVKKIAVFSPFSPKADFPAHKDLIERLVSTEDVTGAQEVSTEDEANVVLLQGSDNELRLGMLGRRGSYIKGVNGVGITPARNTSDPSISEERLARTMAHSGVKYVVEPVVDNGEYVAYEIGSMEGARRTIPTRNGNVELADRFGFLTAADYVTNNLSNRDASDVSDTPPAPMLTVIRACTELTAYEYMHDLNLYRFGPEPRIRFLTDFLGQSGLSTGNVSVYDPILRLMWITASGVNKGNLAYDDVVRVTGFTPDFNGVITAPFKVRDPEKSAEENLPRVNRKASVEAFGNLMTYFTSSAIEAGIVRDGNLEEGLKFLQDQELVRATLEQYPPSYTFQLHFHADTMAVNPELVTYVKASADYVPYGDSHASCGTRPEVSYTWQMMARGMLENKGAKKKKIVIGEMPEHGVQIASPYDYETTMHILNPNREHPDTIFRTKNQYTQD